MQSVDVFCLQNRQKISFKVRERLVDGIDVIESDKWTVRKISCSDRRS